MDFHSLMGRASTMMTGQRNDDGITDRLNYRYTVGILVVLAIINMNRLYTDQIKCWVPAFFTPNYDDYVRSVCFVQNTYYVEHSDKIPKSTETKKQREILYYQWIPFLLFVKAFIFYIPRISWNTLGSKSGIQISDLVESAFDYNLPTTDANHRHMCLNFVVDTIDQYCDDHRRQKDVRLQSNLLKRMFSTACCLVGKYMGNYLVVLYLTTKVFYITVGIFQVYLLSNMLGSNFALYGIQVLYRLFRGIHWDVESRLFPKTTLCDFSIREYGHPKTTHEYTVPCVLQLNLFNEQMFTFLYFWYVLIIFLNVMDFFLWIYAIAPQNRRTFIYNRLYSKRYPFRNQAEDQANITRFINEYLEADGFFILSLIKENSSDYVAAEIVYRLYTEKFLAKQSHEASNPYDDIDKKAKRGSTADGTQRRHLCSMIC